MENIAIIFTCYNRKKDTDNCLSTLAECLKETNLKAEFFICDDGSTDGTSELLRKNDLKLNVIQGGGLFWNKGMHHAMLEAVKNHHDFYLMVNDDVDFYKTALKTMLSSYYESGTSCGIVGSTRSKKTKNISYGGQMFRSKKFIEPDGNLQKCDLANWNCFLIDENIIRQVGIIDPHYDHSYGDYDYSIRMQRKGYQIYIAEKYIGECERNGIEGTFKDRTLSKRERLKKFFSPKGMSIRSGVRYALKNMDYLGITNLFLFLGAYIRNLIFIILF